jgi:hypothetical protein
MSFILFQSTTESNLAFRFSREAAQE